MRFTSFPSFLFFVVSFGLVSLLGCDAKEKGGKGQVHAAALCDCFKTASTDNEEDVEGCNDMTKKAISALQDSPKETLAFKQEMALCKKEKASTEAK